MCKTINANLRKNAFSKRSNLLESLENASDSDVLRSSDGDKGYASDGRRISERFSGIVYFKNVDTGTELKIRAPDALKTLTYGVKSIIVDSGASCTLFPNHFADRIGIQKPTEEMTIHPSRQ